MKKGKTMKIRVLMALFLVVFLTLLPVACQTTEGATAPTTTTPTTSTPTTTPPENTRPATEPPTVEELTEGHFWLPELPRITAEKLKEMMDTEDKIISGDMFWDNIYIIDARAQEKFTKLHVPGAINIPNAYYWVLDPRLDPKPEEWDAYYKEQEALERRLPSIPENKLIVVYDGTADDEQASRLVERMIEEFGFDPDNIRVLWKGFYYWWLDLRYPTVAGDYNFPGE